VRANVREGQQVRQYLDGLRTNTVAVTATVSWTIYKWGWQLSGIQALDEATYRSSARSAPWDDAMGVRWSSNPLAMLWPEMDPAFGGNGDGSPSAAAGRPVVIIAAS
jgi:hypothetical protein